MFRVWPVSKKARHGYVQNLVAGMREAGLRVDCSESSLERKGAA